MRKTPSRSALIVPYSGQFADAATQQDNAIKLYIKQNGDTVAGKKIEIIRKDTGGIRPPVAKRLAQELVIRDKVDILAGFVLTPNAMAAGDMSAEAKKFMVVMNAATSAIITKSPYMVRTSLTTPQLNEAFGKWAATKSGVKKVYTMVSDYGPGHDAEAAFQRGVQGGRRRDRRLGADGGRQSRLLRLRPARQGFEPGGDLRLRPGGAQPARSARRSPSAASTPARSRCMGQLEITDEQRPQEHGRCRARDPHRRPLRLEPQVRNERGVREGLQRRVQPQSGLLLDRRLGRHARDLRRAEEDERQIDGETLTKAAEGMAWESPRGPISIDPQTRDIVQNVYVRKVEKQDGKLVNVEIDTIPNVKDPEHERAGSK